MKTSEIEGEFFSRQDIMSSLKKQLGIPDNIAHIKDKKSRGIAALMVEARKSYYEELTESLLKSWHYALMKSSPYSNAGRYRTGKEPMQIISGTFGREVIQFEAPPSGQVTDEMKNFTGWYNDFDI